MENFESFTPTETMGQKIKKNKKLIALISGAIIIASAVVGYILYANDSVKEFSFDAEAYAPYTEDVYNANKELALTYMNEKYDKEFTVVGLVPPNELEQYGYMLPEEVIIYQMSDTNGGTANVYVELTSQEDNIHDDYGNEQANETLDEFATEAVADVFEDSEVEAFFTGGNIEDPSANLEELLKLEGVVPTIEITTSEMTSEKSIAKIEELVTVFSDLPTGSQIIVNQANDAGEILERFYIEIQHDKDGSATYSYYSRVETVEDPAEEPAAEEDSKDDSSEEDSAEDSEEAPAE